MSRLPSRRKPRLVSLLVASAAFAFGCARPPAPEPGRAVVWGYVHLVPKKGASIQGGGYGDRRLERVRRVDYSHTRYAVVFAPTAMSTATSPARLVVRDSLTGARLEPAFAATGPAAGLELVNETREDRIVSIPGAGRLERIAPGRSVTIHDLPLGETSVHLLGAAEHVSETPAQVWVTEGAFGEVDANGRYALRGLAAGSHQLRAWHPRLPPSPIHRLDLSPGAVERVDIEIGVDMHEPQEEAAP